MAESRTEDSNRANNPQWAEDSKASFALAVGRSLGYMSCNAFPSATAVEEWG